MATVRLGYTVGTGVAVDIPLHHTVVCGMTQLSGKTTTLEALIDRAGLSAITFITKRGEGAFGDARRIPPYFAEQADWKYVAAILEASRGERLRFERAWIIRASRGARSLADVQKNVRAQLADPKVRGMNADVYLTLDAYLDDVVPQIARTTWASTVQLHAGLNAMDLRSISVEMQHLVIRSTLEWVLQHANGTIVVVPEAWKFIPQGRGTPVKLAAEAFIRQSAADHNYLWLDSQDIGGIEKLILRSVSVWLLGVQRETNEIKRTLENIPAGVAKPKPEDIATLEIGQFYACWGRHTVKTYVQPAWSGDAEARGVARGERAPRQIAIRLTKEGEITVHADEAKRLEEQNGDLKRENARLTTVVADLRRQIEELRKAITPAPVPSGRTVTPAVIVTPGEGRAFEKGDMGAGRQPSPAFDGDLDALYTELKVRLLQDADVVPVLLRMQAARPELVVEVERKVVTLDASTIRGRQARLIANGFLDEPKTGGQIRAEMKRTSVDPGSGGSFFDPLKAFVRDGILVRVGENQLQKAPGLVVTERELVGRG